MSDDAVKQKWRRILNTAALEHETQGRYVFLATRRIKKIFDLLAIPHENEEQPRLIKIVMGKISAQELEHFRSFNRRQWIKELRFTRDRQEDAVFLFKDKDCYWRPEPYTLDDFTKPSKK